MRDFNALDFFIQRTRVRLIEKYVPENAYLLDIGCGYFPHNLMSLENRIGRAVGVDMDIPNKAPSEKIRFVKLVVEKSLPFPDNEFDCITMLAVLEHLDHPAEIVDECRRVLKKGGKLIVTVPSNYSMPLLTSLATLKLISRDEIEGHKHYFSLSRLAGLLDASGLKKLVGRHYNLFMNLLFVYEK